ALMGCLTEEEAEAVSGMYLFLHIDRPGSALCVDMVREMPSGTDKAQSNKLEKDLAQAEALAEIRATAGE
ncbi:hypothetical protein LCGC14_2790710, partial [marine sediment metagenome]